MSNESTIRTTTALLWLVFALHLAFVLGYAAGSGETHGWPYGVALVTQVAATVVIVAVRSRR